MKNIIKFQHFIWRVGFLFCAIVCTPLAAQSLSAIAAERDTQLKEALAELRTQRGQIAAERLPLARELNSLEQQASALRKQASEIQRRRDSMSIDLDTLRTRIENERKEIDYIRRSLIPDYIASWDAQLAPGKRESTGETLHAYYLQQESADFSWDEKLIQTLALLPQSIDALENAFGGERYSGSALDSEGYVRSVAFLRMGPWVYAIPQDAVKSAGIAVDNAQAYPDLVTLGTKESQAIHQLDTTGKAVVPVDVTLGDALAVKNTREGWLRHIEKGGIWVYPILLFALAAAAVALGKSIQIFSLKELAPEILHDLVKLLRDGKTSEALTLASAQPEPNRAMLVAAVQHADESIELVEEIMYETILGIQPKLERFLNVIAVTAATAPLLGLLGTVTGIIKTFELMGVYGAGDPKPLISGISEALITTELGLVLAIPALILHALLSRKVAGILSRLEKNALALINGLTRSNPKTTHV